MSASLAKRLFQSLSILLTAALISACGKLVYKQDIQQGNVLDQDAVSQLEQGMTKRQVQVLLGTPSVTSPFHADRWDYMNTYAPRGSDPEKRVLTLFFDDNRLASMEGNYLEEENMASEALQELQSPDELPVQDLETLREETSDPTG